MNQAIGKIYLRWLREHEYEVFTFSAPGDYKPVTVYTPAGTAMPARPHLKFTGSGVAISDVAGQTVVDIQGGAPGPHTHPKADITDFAHTHVKADVTDFAHGHVKADISDFSHTHAAADLASGTVAPARLGSGTPDATTYLRGDSTWQMVSGGGLTHPQVMSRVAMGF